MTPTKPYPRNLPNLWRSKGINQFSALLRLANRVRSATEEV